MLREKVGGARSHHSHCVFTWLRQVGEGVGVGTGGQLSDVSIGHWGGEGGEYAVTDSHVELTIREINQPIHKSLRVCACVYKYIISYRLDQVSIYLNLQIVNDSLAVCNVVEIKFSRIQNYCMYDKCI